MVSRTQLRALGLGRGAIDLRIANGRLHRLHQAVYAVGHPVLTDQGRYMAGVLVGGDGAALSHVTAAALWGIWRPAGRVVAVTSPRVRRSRPGLRFHRSSIPPDELATRDRIPVTTVARTLFDLAAAISPGQLARAANEAEIRRLWDLLSLADLLQRHPRRPGAAAVRALIGGAAMVTRSELEDLFIAFLDRAGIPRPSTMNRMLRVGGRWIEVDCVWEEQSLIVELDGYETHRTRAAYEHDRARDRALIARGWRVIRVTWRQLRDEPELLAHDLRVALDRARR